MSVTLKLSSTLVYSEESKVSKNKRSFESRKLDKNVSNEPKGTQEGLESLFKRAKQSLTIAQFEEDRKIIIAALGGNELSNIEYFEKKTRHSFQSIIEAVFLELAEFRKMNCEVGFGGLKRAGKKKWKIVVKFNQEERITELLIGHLMAIGGFTKVYYNFNNSVLLVPRKDKLSSIRQMLNSYENICFLNDKYEPTRNSELLKILPPKPEQMMIGERPVMITPFATCFEDTFCKPPLNKNDVLNRLRLIIHVSQSVMLAHKHKLVHGDLKPPNMLISHQGMGQAHDLGGSCIFSSEDDPVEAANKFRRISRTSKYTYFRDYEKGKSLQQKGAAVNDFVNLGYAGDVFALGISTIEILTGWLDQSMVRIDNSLIKYCKLKDKSFVSKQPHPRKDITSVKSISPQAHESLRKLLDSAMHHKFQQRISAKQYADGLIEIFNELKKVESVSVGVAVQA
jgi:serine/threonine protein kinase